jgi:hypothetical protein
LWSDGAQKSRWIYLPPGQKIDVTNLNEWVFPVGTKLWKEFSLTIGGTLKKVETRLIHKTGAASWVTTTYVWNDMQTSATRLTTGMKPFPGTANMAVAGSSTTGYTGYELLADTQCMTCHQGHKDRVLGMEAILMASPQATGLTYAMLQSQGLFTSSNTNKTVLAAALQIPGVTQEQDALGDLQANCGVCCHNANQQPTVGRLHMRIEIDNTAQAAPAMVKLTSSYTTGVNVASTYTPPMPSGNYYRFRPTDSTHSTVYYRDGQRESVAAMPPLASHAISDMLLARTKAWIDYMTTGNGYPAPLP